MAHALHCSSGTQHHRVIARSTHANRLLGAMNLSISFANALGSLPQALELRSRRAEALSANLANADTPGYLAKDLPFAEMMAGTQHSTLPMRTSAALHIAQSSSDGADGDLMFRIPLQPAVDGNTVDSQTEMAAFAENTVAFEASFSVLNGRFKNLIAAVRGE